MELHAGHALQAGGHHVDAVHLAILENTAHAYWATGQFSSAHDLLDEASRLGSVDLLTRENLAASFAFLGDREQASAHMQMVVEPATVDNAMDLAVRTNANVCNFLMWAAILPRERVAARAANLSVFLREPVGASDLQGVTERGVAEMAMRALDRLRAVYEPCSSYGRGPVGTALRAELGALSKAE